MPKAPQLDPDVHAYVVQHGDPPDDVLRALTVRTDDATGVFARMQIAPEQGAFMTWLTRLIGARQALEIGTFTGYSAICIARGLPEDGRLVCLDLSEEWTAIARAAWAEAGIDHRIDLRIGPAVDSLAAIPPDDQFDLVFIDADKGAYERYLDLAHPRMPIGGVVLVDNVLRNGRVVDPLADDPDTVAIRAFNDARTMDDRWDVVMLPLADGLTLLRKR